MVIRDRHHASPNLPPAGGKARAGRRPQLAVDSTSERAHADELMKLLQTFRGLLESQAEAIVIVGEDGKIVLVNQQAETTFGYTREELLGERVEILIPRELRARHEAQRHRYTAAPHTRPMGIGMDLIACHKDGTEFPVEVSLSRLETDGGMLVTSRISDITARKQDEARLQQAEERFRLAFEHAPIGMAIVALDGTLERVNPALCEITGYDEQALVGTKIGRLSHPDDADRDADRIQELLSGTSRAYRVEKRYINASGDTIWTNLSASVVRDAEGLPRHFIVQLEDISERKLMEERLRKLADFDALTGVRNRRQFEHDLSVQIGSCKRYGEEAALLMIDLDGFKQINDTYGHRVGDDVLKAVAAAIRKRVRSTDTVARLGGDEFAVLLPHVTMTEAIAVAEDVRRCVQEVTVGAAGRTVSPGASIGVARLDRSTSSNEAALSFADDAMYAQKRSNTMRVLPVREGGADQSC